MKGLIEEWKPIKGYESIYEVSNYGKVRRLPCPCNQNKGKVLALRMASTGYLVTSTFKHGKGKTKLTHLIVWDHFGDSPRDGRRLQVDHIDSNRLNNRIDNLQLLTPRENTIKSQDNRFKHSNIIGVGKAGSKWRATIYYNNKDIHLGMFDTEREAGNAYRNALHKVKKGERLEITTPFLFKKASKHRYVYWRKERSKWVSYAFNGGSRKRLGSFKTEEEAFEAQKEFKRRLENE